MSATAIQPSCPTFVVAKIAGSVSGPPAIFRSYDAEGVGSSNCAMWQAARATSAAPTFFKPMKIDNRLPAMTYVDGGLIHNNPSLLAQDEARRIWPASKFCCLVSIGTGRPRSAKVEVDGVDPAKLDQDVEAQRTLFEYIKNFIPDIVSWAPGWREVKNFPKGVVSVIKMANAMSSLTTNSEEVHRQIQSAFYAAKGDEKFQYFRFNVSREVGDIGLGDWAKSDEMAALTASYLGEPVIMDKKSKCIHWLLVDSPTFRRE
jgi:predicted acylesterase/phospholipase RssA